MDSHPPNLAPGMLLDRYELICPIAEGGMACVWIARQTGKHGFERLVAVKTILPKLASEARFQSMFQDEARLSSRIRHGNVVQILDVGEQHGTTYLVMEYVNGDSLSTVHRFVKKHGQMLPVGVLLRILADVCGGLHCAHELRGDSGEPLGVVHRDVSPHNVLVSGSGEAKLIDFGIAKARDRLTGETNTGTIKGKIRYMAPEQALGGAIDRRADLWGIGAIMYDALAGRPPYDFGNDVKTLLALTSKVPPLPLPASVPAGVAAVVARALSKNAQERFVTAAEMQQSIEEAMVAANVATSTASVGEFLAKHVGSRAKLREEAISLGLKAAADRERYAAILRSSAGTMATSTSPEEQHTAATVFFGDNPQLAAGASPSPEGTLSSATLGASLRRGSSGRKTALALGISIAAAGVVSGLFVLGGSSSRASARSAVPPATMGAAARPSGEVAAAEVAAATSAEALRQPATTPAAATASAGDENEPPRLKARPAAPRSTKTPGSADRSRATKPRVDDGF